jgi:hypothetical protein
MRAHQLHFRSRLCWATSVYRSAEFSPSSAQSWKDSGTEEQTLALSRSMGDVGSKPLLVLSEHKVEIVRVDPQLANPQHACLLVVMNGEGF